MTIVHNGKGSLIGVRHIQAILLFLCFIVNYMSRLNVSVAVVAMTNAASTNPHFDEYDWNETQKSLILSSFYWGYILTQFPGSYMCRRFGAKLTMFFSTCGSSALSLAEPICISLGGWQAYCVVRILIGMFQGPFYPCILDHLAKWSPVEERMRLGALSHTGIEIGTIIAMAATGFIAESNLGWPGISYVSGGMGLAWCVLCLILLDNTPGDSRFISHEEKKYIHASQQKINDVHNKNIPIPWKAILSSIPFFSLVTVRIAESWGYSTLQSEMPSYFHGVLDMNIGNNAIFSAIPFVAMLILSYVYLILVDLLTKKKVMTLTVMRKTVNSIAMWIPSVALIGVGFLEKDQKNLAIALMIITIGINGGVTIGSGLNVIDLSPNHAVMLMGIINTVSSCASLVTPLFVGLIIRDESDSTQWRTVFVISALMFFLGNLQYIFFSTSKVQPWNNENYLLKGQNGVTPKQISDVENSPSHPISCIV